MEITHSLIYWITRLDGIQCLLGVGGVFVIIIGLMMYIEDKKKYWVRTIVTGIVMVIITVFIPSTKQMCAILVIPKVANNENVQTLGKDLVEIAHNWMNEIKENKKVK